MCNMLLPHCSQTEEIDEIKIVLGNWIRRSCKAREVTERATKSRLVCPAGRPAGYTRDQQTLRRGRLRGRDFLKTIKVFDAGEPATLGNINKGVFERRTAPTGSGLSFSVGLYKCKETMQSKFYSVKSYEGSI